MDPLDDDNFAPFGLQQQDDDEQVHQKHPSSHINFGAAPLSPGAGFDDQLSPFGHSAAAGGATTSNPFASPSPFPSSSCSEDGGEGDGVAACFPPPPQVSSALPSSPAGFGWDEDQDESADRFAASSPQCIRGRPGNSSQHAAEAYFSSSPPAPRPAPQRFSPPSSSSSSSSSASGSLAAAASLLSHPHVQSLVSSARLGIGYSRSALDATVETGGKWGAEFLAHVVPLLVATAEQAAVSAHTTLNESVVPGVAAAVHVTYAQMSETVMPGVLAQAKVVQRWLAQRVHLNPPRGPAYIAPLSNNGSGGAGGGGASGGNAIPGSVGGGEIGGREDLESCIDYIERALKQQEAEEAAIAAAAAASSPSTSGAGTPSSAARLPGSGLSPDPSPPAIAISTAAPSYLSGQSLHILDDHFAPLTEREKSKLHAFLQEMKRIRRAQVVAQAGQASGGGPSQEEMRGKALRTPSSGDEERKEFATPHAHAHAHAHSTPTFSPAVAPADLAWAVQGSTAHQQRSSDHSRHTTSQHSPVFAQHHPSHQHQLHQQHPQHSHHPSHPPPSSTLQQPPQFIHPLSTQQQQQLLLQQQQQHPSHLHTLQHISPLQQHPSPAWPQQQQQPQPPALTQQRRSSEQLPSHPSHPPPTLLPHSSASFPAALPTTSATRSDASRFPSRPQQLLSPALMSSADSGVEDLLQSLPSLADAADSDGNEAEPLAHDQEDQEQESDEEDADEEEEEQEDKQPAVETDSAQEQADDAAAAADADAYDARQEVILDIASSSPPLPFSSPSPPPPPSQPQAQLQALTAHDDNDGEEPAADDDNEDGREEDETELPQRSPIS